MSIIDFTQIQERHGPLLAFRRETFSRGISTAEAAELLLQCAKALNLTDRQSLYGNTLNVWGAPMSCICATLGDIEKVENHSPFFKSLHILEVGNWVKLCQCQTCSQLWSVDEWDKYNISFARKKSSKSNWDESDVEAQKRHLLKSRGIQEGVTCMQSGCEKSALKGVVFCVDHIYNIGWRE